MSIFALRKIESIQGKQLFFELIIDGVSQYDSFLSEIQSNKQYYKEAKRILSLMNLVSNLQLLPRTQFENITIGNDNVKECEFKTDHLRVYAFHLEYTGKIVVYWGYKNSQDKDIKQFRSIKKRFLETIKP